MTEISLPHRCTEIIQQRIGNRKPRLGIVLGSGLGELGSLLTDCITIAYDELPGFPVISVKGHGANLLIGKLGGVEVACLEGRSHSYENLDFEPVKTYVRTLKLIGCDTFLATNASGSLHESVGPGELVLIKDHINFQPGNPLAGPNDDEFGPRFPPLDNAYDRSLRKKLKQLAAENGITLHDGTYISVLGPSYETAAEIAMFRQWGADAVGMSTVPEVLVANHCGLKVAVIATITNFATGLAIDSHSHDAVVAMANKNAKVLQQLVLEFAKTLSHS